MPLVQEGESYLQQSLKNHVDHYLSGGHSVQLAPAVPVPRRDLNSWSSVVMTETRVIRYNKHRYFFSRMTRKQAAPMLSRSLSVCTAVLKLHLKLNQTPLNHRCALPTTRMWPRPAAPRPSLFSLRLIYSPLTLTVYLSCVHFCFSG